MAPEPSVRRLDLGYFIRPATETGVPEPRVEPVVAYLVRRAEGMILFDTGIGRCDDETEAHYRPYRRDLADALASAGVTLAEITAVVNCHLHFDHCGGNPDFPGRPIFTQAAELSTARSGGYTVDELVDFAGARYEQLDGEAEIWPGVLVLPTPGHTDGHQSLAVTEPDGTIILAGQARDTAAQFGADHLAARARRDGATEPLPVTPPWLARLAALDPRRVLFAHDWSVWEPG